MAFLGLADYRFMTLLLRFDYDGIGRVEKTGPSPWLRAAQPDPDGPRCAARTSRDREPANALAGDRLVGGESGGGDQVVHRGAQLNDLCRARKPDQYRADHMAVPDML